MSTSIGVILPNYNYARYLPHRIHSILEQERLPNLIIFLDDLSTDNSWEIAPGLLASFPGHVTTVRSVRRSGSPISQWKAGLELLDAEFVWIAEADDCCEPGLLAALTERLETDPKACFAFCDSVPIDSEGLQLAADSKAYYCIGDSNPLAEDATFLTGEFMSRCLTPKNMVVNASAVLWRADALRAALKTVEPEMSHWLCAGDWRTYMAACEQDGVVHYLARPLNKHRRHEDSVTHATRRPRHFGEVVLMHTKLRASLGPDPVRDDAMRRHLKDLRHAWNLDMLSAGA